MAGVGKGFDRLAGIYDPLARLVYGRAIVRAQTQWLEAWPEQATVLIVGGGTGWFLEQVLRRTDPARVVYVELSAKMLEKSRVRIEKELPEALAKVEFVEGTVHDLTQAVEADVVCTHFYLDMFEGEGITQEIKVLDRHLKAGGCWSLVDFHEVPRGIMKYISRFLIWMMYRFFRGFTGIQARKLAPFAELLQENGLQIRQEKARYGGMIRAVFFQKGLEK